MVDDTQIPRRRGEAVRQKVLEAAADEVATRGIEFATVADIAARAGVHQTSIYRRWKTRENLLLDALLERSAAAIPDPDTGTLRGDLIALLQMLSIYLRSPVGTALLRAGTLVVDERYNHAKQQFWKERLDALTPLVDRAIDRGELPHGTDAQLTLETLIAPLHLRVLLTGQPLDDTLPERITDLIMAGCSPATP
ncbi:TetR/AcrR family transcriptional regulator [Mycolicibacterium sp. A43C]